MFDTWFLIVPSATPSELAISLLEKPEAISRRISVSRSVSGSGRSRLTKSLRMCSRPDSRRWVTAGCTSEPPSDTVRIAPTSRSEEPTSELQSLIRISYAVFCLKKKKKWHYKSIHIHIHETLSI